MQGARGGGAPERGAAPWERCERAPWRQTPGVSECGRISTHTASLHTHDVRLKKCRKHLGRTLIQKKCRGRPPPREVGYSQLGEYEKKEVNWRIQRRRPYKEEVNLPWKSNFLEVWEITTLHCPAIWCGTWFLGIQCIFFDDILCFIFGCHQFVFDYVRGPNPVQQDPKIEGEPVWPSYVLP